MKTLPGVAALCLSLITGLCACAADDLKSMTGTWKLTEAEIAGQAMPPAVLKTITLKIDNANYEVIVDNEKEKPRTDRGTVALDVDTKPKGMTIVGVDGPNAGKTFLAIYELGGDTLRVCYDLAGEKRPAEFKTAPATKLYLVTYSRVR
jgi:uncharacterized protein (TIGR03067 family)